MGEVGGRRESRRLGVIAVALAFACCLIVSCAPSRAQDRRSAYAEHKSGPVQIALVWPFSLRDDLIAEGVELAVDEINGRGGVLGRPLELVMEDDGAEVEKALLLAETFAEDPRITAVIGHGDSSVSLSVALVYEISNLILFCPASTSPELTEKGYAYVFRNVPTDELIGRRAADLCSEKGLSSLAILHSDDHYGIALANAFEKRMNELELRVADRRSFRDGKPAEVEYILDRLAIHDVDGFLFAGPVDAGAVFLESARDRGFTQPVIGGDRLDSPRLLEMAPRRTNSLFIITAYNPHSSRAESVDFHKAFLKTYNRAPDAWAALGYDAVKVLARAMEQAGSTDPVKVAPALHGMKGYMGVTGAHSFDEQGDVPEKTVVVKSLENGVFRYLDFESAVQQ